MRLDCDGDINTLDILNYCSLMHAKICEQNLLVRLVCNKCEENRTINLPNQLTDPECYMHSFFFNHTHGDLNEYIYELYDSEESCNMIVKLENDGTITYIDDITKEDLNYYDLNS
jgi:hypothetical protein